jgi:hypothetical protein
MMIHIPVLKGIGFETGIPTGFNGSASAAYNFRDDDVSGP